MYSGFASLVGVDAEPALAVLRLEEREDDDKSGEYLQRGRFDASSRLTRSYSLVVLVLCSGRVHQMQTRLDRRCRMARCAGRRGSFDF
jgi:hypothetical protein